jgi:FkbM family methyltransferase
LTKKRLFDVVAVCLLVMSAGAASFRFVGPVRGLMLYAAGRAPGCTVASAMRTEAMLAEQESEKTALKAASKVAERDAEGNTLWETPEGRFWMPKGQGGELASILAEQRRRIYGSGEYAVKAGDIVMDCGAHVGTFVRSALNAGAKLVVAVEPAEPNLACLRRNLAGEIADGRVIVVPKGVWNEETTLSFQVDTGNSAGDAVVPEGQGNAHIHVTTIDRIAKELKLPRIDYIKFDIEGAERNALSAAREVVARSKPRLAVSAYHLPDDPTALPALVSSLRRDYSMTNGPCGEVDGRIVPHTLLFK